MLPILMLPYTEGRYSILFVLPFGECADFFFSRVLEEWIVPPAKWGLKYNSKWHIITKIYLDTIPVELSVLSLWFFAIGVFPFSGNH